MSTRNRTARRFQVEALEGHRVPGGLSGGVIASCGAAHGIGAEVPQAHVVPSVLGGASGGVLHAVSGIGEEIPQRA
jgi:hypothetical protein